MYACNAGLIERFQYNTNTMSFSVSRSAPQLIVPKKPTPRELKNLSDIDDQQGLRFQISFILFYQASKSKSRHDDPVKVIRDAVGEALVEYYPLAGRLIEGPNRKLIVDCTAEGVLFIEADADADVTLQKLVLRPPFPWIDEVLHDVPGSSGIIGCPLLLIQVTRLRCGGFIFAIRLNHTMSDAVGLLQFLNSVADIAMSTPHAHAPPPVWQRHIFNARCPPRITWVHHEYPTEEEDTSPLNEDVDMIHRSFFFGSKEMNSIRSHLPPHLRKSSSFEVLTACLWRCRTLALQPNPNQIVRVCCINNARGKLPVPAGFYGNAVVFPCAMSKAKLLCENPLGYAVELVKKTKIQTQTSSSIHDYFKSVADLMVIKGRPSYVKDWNFIVSDLTRLGFQDLDFGWGKAVYGGITGAYSCISVHVKGRNNDGEVGTLVPIWLPLAAMERFQDELLKMINSHDIMQFPTPKL